MAKELLNPCPRCGGSVLPVEYTDRRMWRCTACTRTLGDKPVEAFTEADVKQEHRANKHIIRRYC